MDEPVVLINSCSNFAPEHIVKGILDTDTLPDGKLLIENVTSYPWSIDTKYYTAEVQLCTTEKRTIGNQNFASCLEAFVVYFNPEEEDSFQQVKTWLPYLDQLDPEIKLLVCERCTENSNVNRLTTQTWCIDNSFELVELSPEEQSDSETEDDFVETTGMKRIIQSLHAHPWPNLTMKDSRNTVSPYIRQLMKEEHDAKQNKIMNGESQANNDDSTEIGLSSTLTDNCSDVKGPENSDELVSEVKVNGEVVENQETNHKTNLTEGATKSETGSKENKGSSTKDKKVKQPTREERIDNLFPSDQALFEALGQDDPGGQSFEELFEKFASMKEKANCLPLEERKKYAETVAIAFWRAMGGDEDEIGELDD